MWQPTRTRPAASHSLPYTKLPVRTSGISPDQPPSKWVILDTLRHLPRNEIRLGGLVLVGPVRLCRCAPADISEFASLVRKSYSSAHSR